MSSDIGGDEFLVLFPADISTSAIQKRFETMIRRCDKKIFKINGQTFKVSFSYGVSLFARGSSIEAIIERADQEMYRQKRYNKLVS